MTEKKGEGNPPKPAPKPGPDTTAKPTVVGEPLHGVRVSHRERIPGGPSGYPRRGSCVVYARRR